LFLAIDVKTGDLVLRTRDPMFCTVDTGTSHSGFIGTPSAMEASRDSLKWDLPGIETQNNMLTAELHHTYLEHAERSNVVCSVVAAYESLAEANEHRHAAVPLGFLESVSRRASRLSSCSRKEVHDRKLHALVSMVLTHVRDTETTSIMVDEEERDEDAWANVLPPMFALNLCMGRHQCAQVLFEVGFSTCELHACIVATFQLAERKTNLDEMQPYSCFPEKPEKPFVQHKACLVKSIWASPSMDTIVPSSVDIKESGSIVDSVETVDFHSGLNVMSPHVSPCFASTRRAMCIRASCDDSVSCTEAQLNTLWNGPFFKQMLEKQLQTLVFPGGPTNSTAVQACLLPDLERNYDRLRSEVAIRVFSCHSVLDELNAREEQLARFQQYRARLVQAGMLHAFVRDTNYHTPELGLASLTSPRELHVGNPAAAQAQVMTLPTNHRMDITVQKQQGSQLAEVRMSTSGSSDRSEAEELHQFNHGLRLSL